MAERIGLSPTVSRIFNKPLALAALTEIAIAALTVCSWITTYVGALQLVNSNLMVAFLFALGVQGMMFLLAHTYAAASMRIGEKRNPIKLLLGWLLCGCFSVYTSALGAYQLQIGSVNAEHERSNVHQKWEDAGAQLSQYRTSALTWLTEKGRDLSAQISVERKRIQSARISRRAYLQENLSQLLARQRYLETARLAVTRIITPGAAAPGTPSEARQRMDEAYSSAADASSTMPTEFRSANPIPQPSHEVITSSERQTSFFSEIRQKSPPAIVAVVVAFLLDFIPLYILWAHKPSRTFADRIRRFRRSRKEFSVAWTEDLSLHLHQIRVAIDGYDMESLINFGSDQRALYLEDLQENFEQYGRMLGDVIGQEIRVVGAKTTSGAEIVPGIPLAAQLEGDLIRLSVESIKSAQERVM